VTAVLLALAAAVGWGCSDFLGGLQARSLPLLAVLAVAMPSGLLVLGPILAARGEGPPGAASVGYAVLAGATGLAGISALYRGLAVGAMGVVAPISATAPLIPVTVGVARGERPSALQAIGMAAALVGIVLAGREPRAGSRGRVAIGAGLGLLAAGSFGLSLVAFDAAAEGDPYWATLVVRLVGCAVVLAAFPAARPALPRARRSLSPLVAVGLFDATATMCFSVATTRGLLSVVSVVASLFPVVVVVLARVVLGERPAAVQMGGAAAAVAGAALISAG